MLVRGHLHVLVPRQRTAEGDWQTSHLGNQRIHQTGRVFPSHFDQKGKKRDCRSTSVAMWVLFDPVIKSPSQCPGTARSFTSAGRSRRENPSIIYTPPWLSLRRNALGPPYPPPRQMPCQFFLEDATGLNEQAPIDSFVGHLHLLIIWKRPPQPAGDLFGRPLQTQFISNGPL